MKKKGIVILCAVLAVLIAGGGVGSIKSNLP